MTSSAIMTNATIGTSSSSITSSNPTSNRGMILQVRFEDFEDLTKRLVLLPRIEDEGRGAVVASFDVGTTTTSAAVVVTHDSSNKKDKSKQQQQLSSSLLSPEQDDDDAVGNNQDHHSSESSTECRDEKEDRLHNNNKEGDCSSDNINTNNSNNNNLVGSILVGTTSGNKDNLLNADFATILSTIRGQKGPIVLELEQPVVMPAAHNDNDDNLRLDKSSSASEAGDHDNNSTGESDSDEASSSQKPTSSSVPTTITSTTPAPSASTSTGATTTTPSTAAMSSSLMLSGRLSAWGSRMRASAQMAAETASTVAVQSLQAAAASRAAAAAMNNNNNNTGTGAASNHQDNCCGIHIQTSLGAFLPLDPQKRSTTTSSGNHSPRSSELTVTTSSVLYIRKSAVEPCPLRGYCYQWYKGLPSLTEDDFLLDNNNEITCPPTNHNTGNNNPSWISLPGATSASFQPSTTEVGYRLLCLVTVDPKAAATDSSCSLMDSDEEDDDSDSDDDDNNKKSIIMHVRCMTAHVVAADLSLFNGARQALVRGAHFGGLEGRGNAHGRNFRVQVEVGYQHKSHRNQQNHGNNKKRVASAVKIDQVSGETAEPLHTEPFYRVSAHSSYTSSKALDLKFRTTDLADTDNCASVMSALVGEEGLLELVAPNRFARESLLLAIGIANFRGNPADLDATTILYAPASAEGSTEVDSISGSEEDSMSSSSNGSKRSVNNAQVVLEPKGQGGPQVVTHLMLSPAERSKRRPDDGSVASIGSAGDLSTIESSSYTGGEPLSLLSTPQEQQELHGSSSASTDRQFAELEQEVAFLRSKLAKKDKVVSELQRHVARSDAALHQANQQVSECQQKASAAETELKSSQRVQNAAEKMVDQHLATMKKLKADHADQISKLHKKLECQANTIADLEKIAKSHQNEKAVLAAAVEARESKLGKMAELQASFVALSNKISQQDQWRKELDETTHRYQELKGDLQNVTEMEKECRHELESTKETLHSLQEELLASRASEKSCRDELKVVQTKNQKLKSERNSYKQRAESLAKEISRICRNGRTMADIERVLANDAARQEEVQLLRKQKRKALEECHSYRKSYEQSRTAQQLMMHATAASPNKKKGVDPNNNSALLLERNVELERLVTELTEYVDAKEMQLETMKQINTALQDEIHDLARANLHRNEI